MPPVVIPVSVPTEVQHALGAFGSTTCAVELRPNLAVIGALSPTTGIFTYSVFAVPEDDVASGRGAGAIAPNSTPVVSGAVALAPVQHGHTYELMAAIPWTGHVMLLVRNRAVGTLGVFSLDARNGTWLSLGALSFNARMAHFAVAATGAGDLVLVEALPPAVAVDNGAAADSAESTNIKTNSTEWDVSRPANGAAAGSSLMQPFCVRVFAAAPLIAAARFAKSTSVAHGWSALPALTAAVDQMHSVPSPCGIDGSLLRELTLVRNTRASFRIVMSMLPGGSGASSCVAGFLAAGNAASCANGGGESSTGSAASTFDVNVAVVHVVPSHDEPPTVDVAPLAQPPATPPVLSPASPAAHAPSLVLRMSIPAPGRVEDPTPTNTDVTMADITVTRDANGFDAVEECSICFCPFELTAPPPAVPTSASALGGHEDASQPAPPLVNDESADEPLAGDATVTLLGCGHQFHYECIQMALARAGGFKAKGQYIRFGGLKCPMGCGALVREAALCPALEPLHVLRAVVGKLAAKEDEKIAAAAATAAAVEPGKAEVAGPSVVTATSTTGTNVAEDAAPIPGLSVSSPLLMPSTAPPSSGNSVDGTAPAAPPIVDATTAAAAAVADATQHASLEDRLKRHLFYLCAKCDEPFYGGPYDCQATLSDPECSPAALICDRCLDDFSCPSHGRTSVVYKCARCWGRATRRFMGRQFMCEGCLAEKGKPLPAPTISAAVVPVSGGDAPDGAAIPAAPPVGSAFAAVPLADFAVVGHDANGIGCSVVGCGSCNPGLLH